MDITSCQCHNRWRGRQHTSSVALVCRLQLACLVTGLGGAASAQPCFLCVWVRAKPFEAAAQRNLADAGQLAVWATQFLKLIHAAEVAINEAKQAAKQAAKQGGAVHREGAKRKSSPEFSDQREKEAACAVQVAKVDRDKAVASVQDAINKLASDNPMIVLWHDALWLACQNSKPAQPVKAKTTVEMIPIIPRSSV
jgi:hypothetical protein